MAVYKINIPGSEVLPIHDPTVSPEESARALSKALGRADLIREMIETRGWKLFYAFLEQQLSLEQRILETELDEKKFRFQQGAIKTLKTILHLPAEIAAVGEDAREKLSKKERQSGKEKGS